MPATLRKPAAAAGDELADTPPRPVARMVAATQGARRMLVDGIRKLPDVALIGECDPDELYPLRVLVPSLRSSAATAVFQLEAEASRRYPGARLNLLIEEAD